MKNTSLLDLKDAARTDSATVSHRHWFIADDLIRYAIPNFGNSAHCDWLSSSSTMAVGVDHKGISVV